MSPSYIDVKTTNLGNAGVGNIQVFVGSITGIREHRVGGIQRTACLSIASGKVEGAK